MSAEMYRDAVMGSIQGRLRAPEAFALAQSPEEQLFDKVILD
jgi:hypothetical protein